MEIHDPWLAKLVRRAEAGEDVLDSRPSTNQDEDNGEKIEALAEMICNGGEESSAALFVLMGALENSKQPKLLANSAKHFAFARCAELNLYGMVDAQIPVVESELLAGDSIS